MAKKSAKPAPKKSAKKTAAKSTKGPAKRNTSKLAPKAATLKKTAKPVPKRTEKPSNKATGKTAPKPTAAASKTVLSTKATKSATGSIHAIFSPLDDRLIVEELKVEARTPGGLYIPDTVEQTEGPRRGKVLAVGRGHHDKKGRLRPLDVQLGDTVLFESYMGSPLKIGDRECVVLRESQLLGIVNS